LLALDADLAAARRTAGDGRPKNIYENFKVKNIQQVNTQKKYYKWSEIDKHFFTYFVIVFHKFRTNL
jgi:hypothetical protein